MRNVRHPLPYSLRSGFKIASGGSHLITPVISNVHTQVIAGVSDEWNCDILCADSREPRHESNWQEDYRSMSVSLLKLYSDHLHVSMPRAGKIEGGIRKGNSVYRERKRYDVYDIAFLRSAINDSYAYFLSFFFFNK